MKKRYLFLIIILVTASVWFLTGRTDISAMNNEKIILQYDNDYLYAYGNGESVNYTNTTGYSRTKEIEYAEKCCYRRNNQYYGYGQDCANFVSQCLYSGGIPMKDNWYSYKMDDCFFYCGDVFITWSRAPEQYAYFKKSEYNYKNFSIKNILDIKNAIKEGVQAGDLIYFDNDKDTVPDHAAIISKVDSSMIYYCAHTFARYNQPLSNYFKTGNKRQIYIIMLKDNV